MPVTFLPTLVTTPALVAAECRQADRGGSRGQVVVRMAHACGVHADLHLIVDGVADLDLVDPEG
jgi:hypothetical protein